MGNRSNISLVGNTTYGENRGDGASIYKGKSGGNLLQFKTISSTGDTVQIIETDDQIYISGASATFTEDIVISLAAGKTFGRYENNDIIPAIGKTANEVILMSLVEPLVPTVNLSSSASNVIFGLDSKTVNLTFSYIINTLGASVDSVSLEWRRNNSGAWSVLSTNVGATTYNHTIDDSADRFNATVINYRYTVIDSAGATGETTYNVTPQSYTAPAVTYTAVGSIVSYETQTIRELGNKNTTISGSITSNRSLVDITRYEIQRSTNDGAWTAIQNITGLGSTNVTITSYPDTAASASATKIEYRIAVYDEYIDDISASPNYSTEYSISFRSASYYGYNSATVLTGADIIALGNQVLATNNDRTLTNVTSGVGNYTYISYPASYGNLTSIKLGGVEEILTAFSKLSDVNVTVNTQTIGYIVYRSIATNAFTSASLVIS